MATASGNKTVNLWAYDRDQSYQRVDFSQPQKPAALSVGREQVVQPRKETLKASDDCNAGGNISDDVLAQLEAWADLHGRLHRLCGKIGRLRS